MRIAHVASEVSPYSETGGLAQVVSALPRSLATLSGTAHNVAVFSPLYPRVLAMAEERGEAIGAAHSEVTVRCGGRSHRVAFRSLKAASGVHLHFLECPALFEREGIYGGANGAYADNGERFGILCRAVLAGAALAMGGEPDVYHCHDWQTGLLPALVHSRAHGQAPRTVFTIHNLAYQGCFSKELVPAFELPWSMFVPQGFEFYDQLNMLKAGVAFADVTTTVSESYAHEIRTPEFGCNLDGFLRADCPRLVGIRNGLDTAIWDPAKDTSIAKNYSKDAPGFKAACRRALLAEYNLEASDDTFVLGIVSRFAEQKGLDLLADIVPTLAELGTRLVVVGNGDAGLEKRFAELADAFPTTLGLFLGYSTAHAHRVFAGADAFVMPSRFEPCGLGQMAAMRYGAPPIVHAVGGLRDTVVDVDEGAERANGFCFDYPTPAELLRTIELALAVFQDRVRWNELVGLGMGCDWSWQEPAKQYLRLYE